ncbi:MAG: hypothetical protein P9E24_05050 [Candidatus Competibacter sp.]|nr:hypothetical protein [Candidatus Competibacter sp.]MDG4584303.1 hypothetical protein [Candidatus Competibacter sp.]
MKWQSGQSGNPGGRKPGTGKIEKLRAVLAALASGYLPVNQAAGILQGLGNLAKLVELDELEKRIAALEGKQG